MAQKGKSSVQESIKRKLIERFADYPLESRLPSDRELATEFSVAFLTINRVMRELEAEGYIERRARKGTYLASRERTVFSPIDGSNPNRATIIYAYPNYFSYHYWQCLHLAEEQTLKSGLGLLEYKLNPGSSYEGLLELAGRREDIRGLILQPVPGTLRPRVAGLLADLPYPVVTLEPLAQECLHGGLHAVFPDWQQAGWLKADCLLRAGHKRIGYICNEPDSTERALVIEGIRQAIREAGLRRKDLSIFALADTVWQDSRLTGYNLTSAALQDGCTGLIFDSRNGAVGCLRRLRELGVRVPEEVSIISGGDDSGGDDYLCPPVTSVSYNLSAQITRALGIILAPCADGERSYLIPNTLTGRESVAPPPAKIAAN